MKSVKENLYEKFVNQSDPIHDMGIGNPRWEDAGAGSVVRVTQYINQGHPKGSYVILNKVFRNLNGNITSFTYYSCDDVADIKKSLKQLSKLIYHEWTLTDWFIEKFLELVPKWEIDSLKESVNEKFEEDTDPIKDMGIGLYTRHNFISENEIYTFVAKVFTDILHLDEIPKDILSRNDTRLYVFFGQNQIAYTNLISDYVNTYLFLNNHNFDFFSWKRFHEILKLKYPYLKSWMFPDELDEKFTDQSDPIHDMGIDGIERLKKILNSIPPGSCGSLYELYFKKYCDKSYEDHAVYLVRTMYHTIKNIIEHPELTPQESFEKIVKIEWDDKRKPLKKNVRLKILKKVAELLSIKFDIEVDPNFENNKVNEKFSEEGDPVHDMGIGLNAPHNFNSDDELNMFIAEMLPGILEIDKVPEDILNDQDKNNEHKYLFFNIYGFKEEIYQSRLEKYVKAYLTKRGEHQGVNYEGIHIALKKLHPELKSWMTDKDILVNEKFSEEGDPVQDMGIGLNAPHDFKSKNELNMFIAEMLPGILRVKKLPENILNDPGSYENPGSNWYLYFPENTEIRLNKISKYVFKYLTVKGAQQSADYEEIHIALKKLHPELKSWIIDDKVHKSKMNEKFEEDTDPIKDMGIGLYAQHNFKSVSNMNMFVAEMLSAILRINKIPEDILNDKRETYYLYFKINLDGKLNRIAKFVKKYLTVNNKKGEVDYEKIHFALKKLHPELRSWILDDEGRSINEKFEEDSDPIKDMGIGMLSTLKLGSILQCKKEIKPIINTGTDVGFNSEFKIQPGMYSVIKKIEIKKSSIKKIKIELEVSTYDKFPKNMSIFDLKYSGGEYLSLLADDFFEHFEILPYKVNEKFEEDTDPIKDMGIGRRKAWNKAYSELYNKPPVKTYRKYFEGDPESSNSYCSGKIYWFMDTLKYLIRDFTPIEAFEKAGNESGAYNESYYWLIKIKKEVIEALKKHFDIDIAVKKSVNEKFEEYTDPIKDMGIGSGWRTIPLYGMIDFKPGKNNIKSIEGHIIGDFFKRNGVTYRILEKFKSGIVGIIFTGSEKALLFILSAFYSVENERAKTNRWIFKIRVNEAFSDDSDPIVDMGIGLYAHRDFKSNDEMHVFLADHIPAIIHRKDVPKVFIMVSPDLHSSTCMKSYFSEAIEKYAHEFITINGEYNGGFGFSTSGLAKNMKKGIRISTKDELDNHHELLTK